MVMESWYGVPLILPFTVSRYEPFLTFPHVGNEVTVIGPVSEPEKMKEPVDAAGAGVVVAFVPVGDTLPRRVSDSDATKITTSNRSMIADRIQAVGMPAIL